MNATSTFRINLGGEGEVSGVFNQQPLWFLTDVLDPTWRSSRFVKRISNACGLSTLLRAAASSIASGSPSNWTQISAIVRSSAGVGVYPGLIVCAQAMNKATAGLRLNVRVSASRSEDTLSSGSGNGGTLHCDSP